MVHTCPQCDQSFSNASGLDYHRRNKVCGDIVTNPAPPAIPPSNPMASSAGGSPASFAPAQTPPSQPSQSTLPQHMSRMPPGHGPAQTGTQSTPSGQATPAHTSHHSHPMPQSTPRSAHQTTPSGSQTMSMHDPYAHLSKEQYDKMHQELAEAEVVYAGKMDNVRETISDPAIVAKKIDSLRNSFATKQSMVRKKYGVRLRERRSRAVIEEERKRMGGPLAGRSPQHPQAPSPSADAYASKKSRTSMAGPAEVTQTHANEETPTRKHAASADVAAPLSGGLAASVATPETMDPTRFGRYPIGQASTYGSGLYGAPSFNSTPQASRPKALSTSIELSSTTDSDSDSESDTIPAQLPPPPPRARQSVTKLG